MSSKGKILFIDDNLDMLLIGKRIFTRAGYEFTSARTMQEGLDKIKLEQPDIIILDYILPDGTGTDFMKTLHQDKEYQDMQSIPVVVLTARADAVEDIETCYALGLRAFLYKPFGHRELVNVIDNIVLQKAYTKQLSPKAGSNGYDSEWLEDVSMASRTIFTLSKELQYKKNQNLSDEQQMLLQAIFTSSKRLANLVEKD
jgi:CheY-like chemotaxis protein